MVLPYGGTRKTIEEQVLAAILKQGPKPQPWSQCWADDYGNKVDTWARENGYLAFMDRDLKDHPLLHRDAKLLGNLVWESIEELLPRPMLAMEAFRKIARTVGDRELCWSTEYGTKPLWVVQAKSKAKAARLHLQGFQLPGSVRGLQIMQGSDEVDALSHVTGIVANFIHSLDARHLVSTAGMFYARGGRSLGTIHDGFMTRPSEMGLLKPVIRQAFADQYTRDPLSWPVRVADEVFESWYLLAEQCGTSLPAFGMWEPTEVLESAWVFS